MRAHKPVVARVRLGQSALLIFNRFIDSFCDSERRSTGQQIVDAAEMAVELLVWRMERMDPNA
ncbi:MAG TPA: hypothetical protein VFE27_04625 [Acidobacteriaceae bacterium]|nr:hypothetical protein [Acidobacteriaceae bacterium]